MKTFKQFVSEDAGDKFREMSDEQFADWKKSNPGAATKADKLRGVSSPADKGSQLVKKKNSNNPNSGSSNSSSSMVPYKKPSTPSRQVPTSKQPSVQKQSPQQQKQRKGSMGKWAQTLGGVGSKIRSGAGRATDFTKNRIRQAASIARAEAGRSIGDMGVSYGSDLRGST